MTISPSVITKFFEIGITLLILSIMLLVLAMTGCKEVRDEVRDTRRTQRTITIEKRQEIRPDGQIVLLTTKTTTIVDEITGETLIATTENEQPQILGQIGGLVMSGVKAGATAVAGPAGGAAVDWLSTLITGGAAAATAGGTGYVALRRKDKAIDQLKRHRQQLIDGVEGAKEEMDEATWEKVKKTLAAEQDADLRDHIREATA